MNLTYQRKRLADVVTATKIARQAKERETWEPERLKAFQQERLDKLVQHAVTHSPFHRERLGPIVGPQVDAVELASLPALDKATMMDHFDDVVCDRRLKRAEVAAHIDNLASDEYYLGRYRAMATSGSSGLRGLFVYDRPDWPEYMAIFLRWGSYVGFTPTFPRRRAAVVSGASPAHAVRRVSQSMNFGLHNLLTLSVTQPLPELVARLNAFQPQFMNIYPSAAVLLAEEQIAGRLKISPSTMSTSSELRTPEMTARIEEAFGITPFNLYGTTEGLCAVDCDRHDGQHLWEDSVIVENVDEAGNPVPDGERGTKLLVTNLFNFAQPLIRFELADSVTITSDPCACGRTSRRLRTIDGRSDDMLRLPGADGALIAVHKLQFDVVAKDPEVVEYQVVQRGPTIEINVVPRGAAEGLEARLTASVRAGLLQVGVLDPRVEVVRRPSIARGASGKLQLVIADRNQEQR